MEFGIFTMVPTWLNHYAGSPMAKILVRDNGNLVNPFMRITKVHNEAFTYLKRVIVNPTQAQ